jgi:hypothetical protein
MWGGAVPDALTATIRLLATVHHDDGTIAVPGFADDVRELSDLRLPGQPQAQTRRRTSSHLRRGDWHEFTAEETKSVYLKNMRNGTFTKHPLPAEVQFAPVDAILCEDLDGDGQIDLLMAGNEYQTEVRTGRYDASYGHFLKRDSQNRFKAIPPTESGFIVDGDVKDMELIIDGIGRKLVLIAVNDDSLRVFEIND